MKYSIENKGTGIVMIRVFVPEQLAASFLAFIDQKSRENHRINPPEIKKPSCLLSEDYLTHQSDTCVTLFKSCLAAGMSKSSAISEALKKLKVLGFYNISYDQFKLILTQRGCFKSKTA